MRLRVTMSLMLCAGCYASHSRSGSDAAVDAPRDVGVVVRRDGGLDVPLPLDVPVESDAPTCTLDAEDHPRTICGVRYPNGLVSGAPLDLSIQWSSCRCDLGRSCAVQVEGGVIDLRTESCAISEVCDECTFDSVCHLPALTPGTYRLRVDGRELYDIEAGPPAAARLARPVCFEIPAPPDEALSCSFDWDARLGSAEVCYRTLEDVGTLVHIQVTALCRSCFDWSAGCAVERSEGELLVRPHVQRCDCPSCGVCEEVCMPQTVECRSPALRDGTYRVVLEGEGGERIPAGELVVSDVPGPGEERCTRVVSAP